MGIHQNHLTYKYTTMYMLVVSFAKRCVTYNVSLDKPANQGIWYEGVEMQAHLESKNEKQELKNVYNLYWPSAKRKILGDTRYTTRTWHYVTAVQYTV